MEIQFYIPTPAGWELLPDCLQHLLIQAITDTGYLHDGYSGQERVLETYHKILTYESIGDTLRTSIDYSHLTTKILEELLRAAFKHLNAIITIGGSRYVHLELKNSLKTTFLYTGAILFDPTI